MRRSGRRTLTGKRERQAHTEIVALQRQQQNREDAEDDHEQHEQQYLQQLAQIPVHFNLQLLHQQHNP